MIKKELLALRALPPTRAMIAMACGEDEMTCKHPYSCSGKKCSNLILMRCQILKGILKVSFYYAVWIKNDGNLKPVFDLYIDNQTGKWLTYDHKENMWRTAKVDGLPWMYCSQSGWYRCPGNIWINKEGRHSIKRYLGTEKCGYAAILEYQNSRRKEELEAKYNREIAPWVEENAQVPALPTDWEKWVRKVGIPENYIFYRYQRSGVKMGYCTYCEKMVNIKNPRHNKDGICPSCRNKIVYKAMGKQKTVRTEKSYKMILMQRIKCGFVLREFYGRKSYNDSDYFRKADVGVWETNRVFYTPDAILGNVYGREDYRNRGVIWVPTTANYWRNESGKVYGKTIPTLAKNELKKTGLPEYIKSREFADPFRFLKILQRFPLLEQIVKAGLFQLAAEIVESGSCAYAYDNINLPGICSSGKTLAEQLLIDNGQLKRLRNLHGGQIFLKWLVYEKRIGHPIPNDAIEYFSCNWIAPKDLSFIEGKMSMVQVHNYLVRQSKEQGEKPGQVLNTWKDYLNMAKRLGKDITDEIVYRPAKLRIRHDDLVQQSQRKDLKTEAGKIAKKYPHVNNILHEIKGLYSFAGETYQVRVPNDIADIMVEGNLLCHCVGKSERYYDRIERRESYILFLRRSKAPESPYYTLEVEPDGTIRQKRTKYDRQESDIAEATKFLRQWQKVISKRLTENEHKLAEKSHELRDAGFAQMQKDRVRINTGDLRGKLLVDVLMADLMEQKEETA